MKHKTSLFALLLLAIALSLIVVERSKRQEQLLDEMAGFERYLIPVLLLADGNDPERVRHAMRRLWDAWEVYKSHNLEMSRIDPQWDEDLAMVEQLLQTTQRQLDDGVELGQVHAGLLRVGSILREGRQRHEISFYPDRLLDIYGSLNMLNTLAAQQQGAWSAEDWQRVQAATMQLQQYWQTAKAATLDARRYGTDSSQQALIHGWYEDGEKLMSEFEALVANQDMTALSQLLLNLEVVFMNIYTSFGDFSRDT